MGGYSETEFDVSILAADGTLFVSVQIPTGASREAIESCLFKIENAMAVVEQISQKGLHGLVWERQTARRASCLVARRLFSDPEYTKKFDTEFRRLNRPMTKSPVH